MYIYMHNTHAHTCIPTVCIYTGSRDVGEWFKGFKQAPFKPEILTIPIASYLGSLNTKPVLEIRFRNWLAIFEHTILL